jgi:hypothetical protein
LCKRAQSAGPSERYQPIYLESRRPAMALALAGTLNASRAYDASMQAHRWAGMRPVRKPAATIAILRRLYRQLRGRHVSPESDLAIPSGFASMDLPARAVWALHHIGGLDEDTISRSLGIAPADVDTALHQADDILTLQDAGLYGQQVDLLLEKRELWNEITFALDKHTRARRLIRTGAAVILAAIGLFLIGRESLSLMRILRLRPQALPDEITESYDSPQFYKRFPETPSAQNPRINRPLMDRLSAMEDNQRLRVAFRFYDRNVMLRLRENSHTLEDLYVSLYEDAFNRGLLNNLIANAIELYYKNYDRPYLPTMRATSFRSDYDSIYQAALTLAQEGDYRRIPQRNPEVFQNQHQFDRYLTSRLFLNEVPGIARLLMLEYQLGQSRSEGQPEDADMRQAYEQALFAFTNPGGMNGHVSPAHFCFQRDQLPAFFTSREALGRLLYTENLRQALECLPAETQANSDILEGSESSLMSATLTKVDIMRLSQDNRFFFLGIAPANAAFYDGRVESDLANQARRHLHIRHDVFAVDEEYRLYSVNYAAPLTLPQGFIDDLRARLHCQDTQFEMELQYIYQMRYAHPESHQGWTLLRTLDLHPIVQYTSQQFKTFTRMARQ